ncbi:MAG: hypothetical protein M1829_004732 [Trizodia sp. TS-e1964]|nr:MAG: hypothetical protein M1829_004732 [Trizodia sp. TS-e1964]
MFDTNSLTKQEKEEEALRAKYAPALAEIDNALEKVDKAKKEGTLRELVASLEHEEKAITATFQRMVQEISDDLKKTEQAIKAGGNRVLLASIQQGETACITSLQHEINSTKAALRHQIHGVKEQMHATAGATEKFLQVPGKTERLQGRSQRVAAEIEAIDEALYRDQVALKELKEKQGAASALGTKLFKGGISKRGTVLGLFGRKRRAPVDMVDFSLL